MSSFTSTPPPVKQEVHKPTKPSSITWDEPTLALHDVDRGTRQKIDEPDTPYTFYSSVGNLDDVDSFELNPSGGYDEDTNINTNVNANRATASIAMVAGNELIKLQTTDMKRTIAIPLNSDGVGRTAPKSPPSGAGDVDSSMLIGKLEDVEGERSMRRRLSDGSENSESEGSVGRASMPLDESVDKGGGEVEKDPLFEKKRNMHYNEFEMLKRFRERQAMEDDEDDEEDEEGGGIGGGGSGENGDVSME